MLEKLWLETPGGDHLFFKGLIQFAGAFVHLKKQHLSPYDPVDGKRLAPALRLFKRAEEHLRAYRPGHLQCDVATVCDRCVALAAEIENSGVALNPWDPSNAPQIHLIPARTMTQTQDLP